MPGESKTAFNAADFYQSAGLVIATIPTGIFVICAWASPQAGPWRWSMPLVSLGIGLALVLVRSRYEIDVPAKTIHRLAGFGPFVRRWDEPLSEVRGVELGGFMSREGSRYYTLSLDFVDGKRRPAKVMVDSDDVVTAQRAKDLAAALGVPLVTNKSWQNIVTDGGRTVLETSGTLSS